MIYTLTLNPALDYDIYIDNLVQSELNLSNSVNYRPGGKGINVSIMLNNLGVKSIALGFLSGFTGKYIVDALEKLNIKSDFIFTEGNTRINVKINDKNGETEISGKSSNINASNLEKLIKKISKLNENDILVLSGSIPKGLDEDVYKKISSITRAKIVLDTRGDLLNKNIHSNILIKPNIKELEQVFNEKITSNDRIFELCNNYFLDKNIDAVIVSKGSDGAILVKKDRYYTATIPKGNYINSIGSGDSMVAGYIYGYINNFNEIEKLRIAVACGSATAYSYTIGSRDMVINLQKDIIVKEIIKKEKI